MAWGRLLRITASCIGAIALAGCAIGYVYVQPGAGNSGGYYTGDAAYSGQGYYDDYGTGPYFPGTDGYGYYNGGYAYSGAFGPWGGYGYFGSYPYVPRLTFNIGISNVWNFPGYGGSWYSTVIPVWGCRHRGCDRHGWRNQRRQHGRDDHRDAGGHGTVAVVPGAETGTFALNPKGRIGSARTRRSVKHLPTLLPPGQFGKVYRRASVSFVRNDPAHVPVPSANHATATPARPAYFAHPLDPAVVDQRSRSARNPMPEPHDFSVLPRRSDRAPVPKFVNRAALTRDPPTAVHYRAHASAHSAYRRAIPVTTSSSRKPRASRPRTH